MFISNKNFIELLMENNERLTHEIIELQNKQIEEIKKDHKGRLSLARMCNELAILSNDDIRKIVTGYLGIEK